MAKHTMLQSLGVRVPEACLHMASCCPHTKLFSRSQGLWLHYAACCSAQHPPRSAARLLARSQAHAETIIHSKNLNELREDVMEQRRALRQLPTAAFGQVISAQANFVRVNIFHLDTSAAGSSSSSAPQSTASSIENNSADPEHTHLDAQLADRRSSNAEASTSNSSSPSTSISTEGTASDSVQMKPPSTQLLCTVRALLKKIKQRVLVGDRVRVYGIDWAECRGVVESVQQRSSELADPAVANVEHVLLLFGLTQPPFEPAQVSRFLVSVSATGLPVTLALNKCDLLPSSEVQARLDQISSWGYNAVAVSCQTGQGLDILAQRLAGFTTVVAGPSGAGKSSLINALRLGRHTPDAEGNRLVESDVAATAAAAPGLQYMQQQQQRQRQQQMGTSLRSLADCSRQDLGRSSVAPPGSPHTQGPSSSSSSSSGSSTEEDASEFLAVGDISKGGRGKHTTRTVTLIELPCGGLMADTPGFNQPTLDRVSSADLSRLFPEFQAAIEAQGGCRFTDCLHLAEPDCAVTPQEFERYDHYVKFLTEIKLREEYDVRVMQIAKQRREGAMKVVTGKGGTARYEARLDSKKHRTTSRRKTKQTLWDHEDD